MSRRSSDPAPPVLDEPGSNLLLDLFVLDQRLGALLKTALLREGVAPAHYAVYGQVHRGADTPGRLAERLSLSPGTLTGYLNLLERRGHLRRTKSESDGRSVTLTLTAAGEAKRKACETIVADVVRRLDRSVGGAAARDELRAALGRIAHGLDDVSATWHR